MMCVAGLPDFCKELPSPELLNGGGGRNHEDDDVDYGF